MTISEWTFSRKNAESNIFPYKVIKTHGSESRGQEEAGCMRRMSELFTHSTALKFENAVTKPPRQLSPSYSGLNTF